MSPPDDSSPPSLSSLSLTSPYESIARAVEPPKLPTYRSHDPANNLKRTDPFQFGSRYLLENDDVYEFNAWDHVETDDAYKTYSEGQYSAQRASPVSDFDRARFNREPAKWWDLFYRNNKENFFKDRKWLRQEFPVLEEVTRNGAGRKVVLEVGAGAGNTAFPLIRANDNEELRLHAVDFSKRAVEVMRENELCDGERMCADVWDVTATELPAGIEEESVDVVVMIFILSALQPSEWSTAVGNIYRCLKPGGVILFRDYGRGDLAQVRFKKGRWMGDNFYVRGDGTRVYFFEKEEIETIWGKWVLEQDLTTERSVEASIAEAGPALEEDKSADSSAGIQSEVKSSHQTDDDLVTKDPEDQGPARETGFEILNLGVDRRLIVNRQRKLKMYRCWLQGRFQKKPLASNRPSGSQLFRNGGRVQDRQASHADTATSQLEKDVEQKV